MLVYALINAVATNRFHETSCPFRCLEGHINAKLHRPQLIMRVNASHVLVVNRNS